MALALLLSAIGFVMVEPGGPDAYPWPMRVSVAAILGLPAGYSALVKTPPPWQAGLAGAVTMIAVLFTLLLPFAYDTSLQTIHGATMTVWSVLWFVAAFPFMRTATKK